jgi:hypothetical protein
MYRMFSKQNLRSKNVHLQGVLWETTDFICEGKDCARITKGYGNYVSKLKERVDKLEKQDAAIRQAIADYYFALDLRAHGAVAAGNAIGAIERAMGTRWMQGVEQSRRLAEVAKTVAVPPMLEGEWLVTQGNGRQYTVHSGAKAEIARECGYMVEEIRRDANAASGQSNHTNNEREA